MRDPVGRAAASRRAVAIRSATAADRAGMLAVAAAVGLFPPHELEELGGMIDAHLGAASDPDQVWIVCECDDALIGLAYHAPERMTDGAWNLYLIAVHPNVQGQGHGAALLRHVEDALRMKAARILLVETAGTESFAPQRAFYRHCGYEEEARIRDFYKAGEDKIIFRKALEGGAEGTR